MNTMNNVNEPTTTFKRFTIDTNEGDYTFDGTQLGFGTSRRGSHLHPPYVTTPPPGVRCSGCRWTETTIYWSSSDSKYIVHIVGRSIVPGEQNRYRTIWADEADDVLDSLLISPPRHVNAPPGTLELPQPNAHALEEAAERDAEIAEVLKSWNDDN